MELLLLFSIESARYQGAPNQVLPDLQTLRLERHYLERERPDPYAMAPTLEDSGLSEGV